MPTSLITAAQLTKRREAQPAPVLLDVNDASVFDAQHLKGAVNANVFEMNFLAQVREKLGLQPEQPVIVYGPNSSSYASRLAADKLVAAGFAEVEEFRGGLEAAIEAGLPLEGDAAKLKALQQPERAQGQLPVDTAESQVRWIGRNLASQHEGTVGIQSGYINVVDGILRGGELVLDLEQISCIDIGDEETGGVLLKHFRDMEFFHIDQYPLAKVQIEHVDFNPHATPGSPNYEVVGSLTLKGVTAPVGAKLVGDSKNKLTWACQGMVEIDRTRWNVIYGSGKFFQHLGMHAVNDHISVNLKLIFGGK
ncbi:MAG: rhodanese y domain and YceI domain protein [Puniceicoccaceae bacterium 5H]|nr:MAG: rhodanese y domain and YceI domain protein [Puniceicoccaceae bacterium 5H]